MPTPQAPPVGHRTVFVGDLHGCGVEFARLLDKLAFDPATDRLLLTGDAFSRGPDPMGVWRLIGQTRASMVLGNHDDRLLRQLRALKSGDTPRFKHANQKRTLEILAPCADALLAWLEELPLYLSEERFVLVHAGIDPDKGLKGTSRDQFIALRTWPPVPGIEGPRWHDAYPPGGPPVVFGHDAPEGLVLKRYRDRPHIVGLDSGCVYGGQLSAYILEEDRLVQVESLQEKGRFF